MTNLQAIDLLKGLEQSLDDYCELNDEGKTAFRMAITALEVFGNSEQLPSAEPEGKWTTEEVAELLFNLFGDECACNYNGIDEWLPERCKYTEIADECPNPKEKHGCWMQFLLQGGADMRGEQE